MIILLCTYKKTQAIHSWKRLEKKTFSMTHWRPPLETIALLTQIFTCYKYHARSRKNIRNSFYLRPQYFFLSFVINNCSAYFWWPPQNGERVLKVNTSLCSSRKTIFPAEFILLWPQGACLSAYNRGGLEFLCESRGVRFLGWKNFALRFHII